jgi:hypothetical protein
MHPQNGGVIYEAVRSQLTAASEGESGIMTDLSISSGSAWPDSLDALIAAPAHHTLLFENEAVRILHTRIPAGERTPVHTHCWPCVLFIQSWSDCVRRDKGGNVLFDSRQAKADHQLNVHTWQEALAAHSLENVGDSEINTIQVEIKNTR